MHIPGQSDQTAIATKFSSPSIQLVGTKSCSLSEQMSRSGSPAPAASYSGTRRYRLQSAASYLENLRGEFAIAHPGADFHSRPDIANRPNQVAFRASGNAVTAVKRGVGAKDAQEPFDALETLLCVFDCTRRRRKQSAFEIEETVAAHGEFARGTAGVQRRRNVQKTALVTVNPVAETAAHSLARMIEPLLSVADAIEQFALERACAVVHVPAKIGNVRHNEFRCCARSRRAQIGHEIADREINFVADG
jgi:hypothetical protein